MSATTTDRATEIAYPVYRRFKQWVPFNDIALAVDVGLVIGGTDAPQHELRRIAERAARSIKAEKLGYRPRDEMFYSRTLIETLLPYALRPDAIPPPTIADEQQLNRVHAGKEGYGGWETSIADVRTGLAKVSRYHRNLLTLRYVEGCSVPWLARKLGVTDATIYSAIGRAIRQIQNVLGGRNPWPSNG